MWFFGIKKLEIETLTFLYSHKEKLQKKCVYHFYRYFCKQNQPLKTKNTTRIRVLLTFLKVYTDKSVAKLRFA